MPVGVSAYIPLANITLGSSASSVTFSSIPATFRDLVLVMAGTTSDASDTGLQFNGSATGYSGVWMIGTGSGSGSSGATRTTQIDNGYLGTTQSSTIHNIMDYSATDKHKTVVTRNNNPTYVMAVANRWANTSAITSILVRRESGTFSTGCSFALYGIAS